MFYGSVPVFRDDANLRTKGAIELPARNTSRMP